MNFLSDWAHGRLIDPANNFPNWERLWFCSSEFMLWDDLAEEALHQLQLAKPIRRRLRTPHALADRLLRRIGWRIHVERIAWSRWMASAVKDEMSFEPLMFAN